MRLQDNPFYLLNVSCTDDRRRIVSAAEESSFSLNSDICEAAQSILLNSTKRLRAEMNWFPGVRQDTLSYIRACIKKETPIISDQLQSNSLFNALVYNVQITHSFESELELCSKVLDIAYCFSCLDVNEIASIINLQRNIAKMPEITSADTSSELNYLRTFVQQIIKEKTNTLSYGAYIRLCTSIGEKLVADKKYRDSIILYDIIDEYGLMMQSTIDESAQKIKKQIQHIRAMNSFEDINGQVLELIQSVQQWDRLVQPIQLKSQANGIPHKDSEGMGNELRSLSLYLNNEKKNSKIALKLTNAMKGIFAELGSLSEQLEKDSETLEGNVQYDETINITSELLNLQNDLQGLKSNPTTTKINDFISKVKQTDEKIKTLKLDLSQTNMYREKLCYIARGVAISLHNDNHETVYALSMAEALLSEFGDLSSVKEKLTEDVNTLRQQLSFQTLAIAKVNQQKAAAERSRRHGWVFLFVILIILVVGGHAIRNKDSYTSSTTSSRSTTSNSSSKTSTSTGPGKSNTSGTNNSTSSRSTTSNTSSKTSTSTGSSKSNTSGTNNSNKFSAFSFSAATAKPAIVSTYNGKIFINPSYEGVCPFRIIADSTTDYYIYLKCQAIPKNTTVNRQKKKNTFSNEDDIAFFLKAGQTVDIDIPIGVYKLYYATGSSFYGTKLLFGDDTRYYSADDLLSFYADSEYYRGHTITLKATYSGNFDTDPINETQFPTRE